MVGILKDLTINRDGTQNLTVTVEYDCREMFDDLHEKEIDIEIKKHYAKRSLDASAKAWVMIDALAEKLRISKTDVYRNAIREIGGVSDIVCVKKEAVETLCKNWKAHGIGWMAEPSPSKLPGCMNVTLWYGSSTYNTKQMGDLISILVQECNEQGIPTMSEKEIERTMELWNKKVAKRDELDSSDK